MTEYPLNLTRLIESASAGDREARSVVIESIYAELKMLAAAALRRESNPGLFQTTALVHEAYIRLFSGSPLELEDRSHFFRLAARQMRFILVEQARRGSHSAQHLPIDQLFDIGHMEDPAIVALHLALQELATVDPEAEQVVELRVFGGYEIEQTARILSRSEATVRRDWTFARTWLFDYLSSSNP